MGLLTGCKSLTPVEVTQSAGHETHTLINEHVADEMRAKQDEIEAYIGKILIVREEGQKQIIDTRFAMKNLMIREEWIEVFSVKDEEAFVSRRIARERCWRYRGVVDLDTKGFFDNIDHELLMRAVGAG